MPSGAKKRKAAKKKKEQETQINTNPSINNPQGNDELKSQDEKGSDGGSPPAHGDDDHPFNEGNEEVEERDLSAAQPSAAASKDLEEVPSDVKVDETDGGKEGVVVIEWDMKSEGSCESKDVSVGHVESAKVFGHENGNSGSSNDEAVTLKNSKDESHDSIKEPVAFDELVKTIESSYAKMAGITQNVEETGNSVVESSADSVNAVVSVPDVKNSETENALVENSIGSQIGATDLSVKKNEDKVYAFSDQNVRTSTLEETKPKESDNNISASVSHSPIPPSTIGAEHVKDSDIPECSENKPLVASGPNMVQKTSWWNCCGLFEVLSGSNR